MRQVKSEKKLPECIHSRTEHIREVSSVIIQTRLLSEPQLERFFFHCFITLI